MPTSIRPIKPSETPLLLDFLYEAIFQEEDAPKAPRTILQLPEIWAYIDGFGSLKDDLCLVAEVDGTVVGAVWTRCIRGYGHVTDSEPEFAIALYPEHRGCGIGTRLMRAMFDLLRASGHPSATLSVQKRNPALRFYQRLGFETIADRGEELLMRVRL